MAKSALEKQLEKQRKERERIARQEAIRTQATTIINGQPIIEGVRILDDTAEEFLRILLQQKSEGNNHVGYEYETIPSYMQPSLELEKLVQYGMISNVNLWLGGGSLQLQPKALTYFHDKEEAIMKSKENKKYGVINFGNYIVGNVTGSILNVDNSIHDIEKAIEEKGAEDKEELKELLEEVKELIDNIQSSRSVPKQKRLFQKLTDHASKHGWFYGAVIQLIGTAVITMVGA